MRDIPPEVLALLDVGQITYAVAYQIETDDPGDGAIWSGIGPLQIELGGQVFTGITAPGLAVTITHEVGSGANGVSVNFASTDSTLVSLFLAQDYRNRWVTIYDLYFNIQGTLLLHAEPVFFGTIDQILTRDIPGDPGEAAVTVQIEGEAQGAQRGLGRLAADQDQRLIDSADTSMRLISTISERTLAWFGKEPKRAAVALDS